MRTLALAATLSLAIAGGAWAEDFRVGDIVIADPRVDPIIKGQPVAAGYLTIRNEGETADRIVAAHTDIAERVEFHAMTMVDGAMRMTPLETVEAPPGESTAFEPGGAHLMLIAPARGLASGETFAMTLELESAGEVEITFRAQAPGAGGSGEDGGHADQ